MSRALVVPSIVFAWIFALWVLSWAAVEVSGMTSTAIGEPTAAHFNQEVEPLSLYVWSRWDGQWYLNIAYGGYGTIPYDAPFFPMYPMLIAGVHAITSFPLAGDGLIVSYFFLVLGLVYLYKLARLDLDRAMAERALLTLVLFPTAFFLVSVYTESLLLFLFCAALYYARLGRWWLVAPLALAAGLTKITALALLLALLCEALSKDKTSSVEEEAGTWPQFLHNIRSPRALLSRLTLAKLAALAAAPLGILAYMLFLFWRYGDPINFITVQPVRFWRVRRTFLEQVWFQLGRFFGNGISAEDLPKVFDMVLMLLLTGLAIYMALRMRVSYAALVAGFLIIIVMSGDTLSLNRYILQMGPVFVALAALSRDIPRRSVRQMQTAAGTRQKSKGLTRDIPWIWVVMVILFVPLQIYFALRFFTWGWVG